MIENLSGEDPAGILTKYTAAHALLRVFTLLRKVLRMTMPTVYSTTAPVDRREPDALAPRVARATFTISAVLAVCADLLVHDGITGLGMALWIALLAWAMVALARRSDRHVTIGGAAWLATAVLFSAALAWRDQPGLQALDVLATAAALGLAALTIGHARAGLFAARLRDTVWAAAAVVRSVAVGVLLLLFRDLAPARALAPLGNRVVSLVRPIALAAIVALVFGALLRDADPIFASLVALPRIDVGVVISHALLIGFAGWIVAGWARAALLPAAASRRAPDNLPFAIGAADLNATLGTLVVLFGAFVAVQLGWMFGGERFLRAHTHLSAAQYARGGFFQTVWVVALVVAVLVGTRAALRPEPRLARRHTLLSAPVLALLAVMILSAVLRLTLYVRYYGLTIQRVYPLVFLAWLTVVLAWLAVTVLRGWPRPFVAGAVISGFAMLAALNVANPGVLVARINIARATRVASSAGAEPLDLAYLASLGGDAARLATAAVIASPDTAPGRCAAARTLLRQWGAGSRARARDARPASWRYRNFGAQSALDAVLATDGALRQAAHASCPLAQRAAAQR
jgi:hypothetical protein